MNKLALNFSVTGSIVATKYGDVMDNQPEMYIIDEEMSEEEIAELEFRSRLITIEHEYISKINMLIENTTNSIRLNDVVFNDIESLQDELRCNIKIFTSDLYKYFVHKLKCAHFLLE